MVNESSSKYFIKLYVFLVGGMFKKWTFYFIIRQKALYNLINTSGHLTIPETPFQKKVVQSGDISLEFAEYLL